MTDITHLLRDAHAGDESAFDHLVEVVYAELRGMAAAKLACEKVGVTLDATGLVHEAFLKLSPNDASQIQGGKFESRRHFFGAASEAMRRILIDRARARLAQKRGGDIQRAGIEPDELADSIDVSPNVDDERLQKLDLALSKLEKIAPEKVELVKLRYFVGMKIREAAEVLGISTATADRYWAFSRAWLQTEMESMDNA